MRGRALRLTGRAPAGTLARCASLVPFSFEKMLSVALVAVASQLGVASHVLAEVVRPIVLPKLRATWPKP